MAHKHAAIKALRQSARHFVSNQARRRTIEILTRQYRKARADGQTQQAATLLPKLTQAIDKASGRHVLHRNTAARLKSRLMRACSRS